MSMGINSDLFLLPYHPLNQEGEAFISYMLKVGHGNHIHYISELKELFFPKMGNFMMIDDLAYSWKFIKWKSFSNLLGCDQEVVVSSSLNELQAKLGERSGVKTVKPLVNVKDLRYCPKCFQEEKPYLKMWRLKNIEFCHIHKVWLRKRCPNCKSIHRVGKKIFPIHICGVCGYELKLARSRSVSNKILGECVQCHHSVNMLLHPIVNGIDLERFVDGIGVGIINVADLPRNLFVEIQSNLELIYGYWVFNDCRLPEIYVGSRKVHFCPCEISIDVYGLVNGFAANEMLVYQIVSQLIYFLGADGLIGIFLEMEKSNRLQELWDLLSFRKMMNYAR